MESELVAALTAATRGRLPETVERVIDDLGMVRRVAEASYRHDNGFTKVVLGTRDNARIRFHVWATARTSESNVHNHRWDFASMVLAGALDMEYYEVLDRDTDPGSLDVVELEAFRYVPRGGGPYDLRPLGPVLAARTSATTGEAGYRYHLRHHRLHRVTAPVTPAVTCFLSAPAATDHTTVLRHPTAPPEDGRVERLTVEETRAELALIRDLLDHR
ncbi:MULTISPECIES: hypothetical protein [unclassified Saccharothrix]|uniref:hypothetical protein n=1 Tax=unclassified Saccharothrix TaxID=2593673 RepID=UPI00307E5213